MCCKMALELNVYPAITAYYMFCYGDKNARYRNLVEHAQQVTFCAPLSINLNFYSSNILQRATCGYGAPMLGYAKRRRFPLRLTT